MNVYTYEGVLFVITDVVRINDGERVAYSVIAIRDNGLLSHRVKDNWNEYNKYNTCVDSRKEEIAKLEGMGYDKLI